MKVQGPAITDRRNAKEGRFRGKTVIVTGGAGGMGAAAATAFAGEGARVAILDICADAGHQKVAAIRGDGGTAEFFEINLAQTRDIERVIDSVSSRFGPADVLFNHAGIVAVAPFVDTTLEQFDAVFNVNLRASFVVCQRIVRDMVANGGGSIVISSSIGASHAFQFESVYCMTKAAVLMLAKSIAVEYRTFGIRANAICPGFVRTAHGLREIELFHALGQTWDESAFQATQIRMCEPEEVARAVLFLASGEASFINGAGLYIDNGWAVKG
jgi:NAD(P)-dependent dehydrogenase (short-subunit alcohol dehydrogenase family)